MEKLTAARTTELLRLVRVSRTSQNREKVPPGAPGGTGEDEPPTFVDLAHDGELQVLPVVLFAVDAKQDSAQFGGQPEGRQQVEVRERAQSGRQRLHGNQVLLGVLETQHIDD